jgi:predicted RNase H-like nuclease
LTVATRFAHIIGVDGCKAGWVAAVVAGAARADVALFESFGALVREAGPTALIAVDIPIGLSEREPRLADVAARQFLGPRGSSVFPAPVRAALQSTTYRDACARSEAASGKKLSQQSYNILAKVRDVDTALRGDAALAARTFEVHPEVSFAVCNGGVPMAHPKRRPEGRAERLALLPRWGREAYARAVAEFPRSAVGHDDIIDALVAAWSGGRIAADRARHFPQGTVPRDACGLAMCIRA